MAEGLVVTDFEGTIRYVNRMAYQILGMEENSMIGKTFARLLILLVSAVENIYIGFWSRNWSKSCTGV